MTDLARQDGQTLTVTNLARQDVHLAGDLGVELIHPGQLAVPVALVEDAALPGTLGSQLAHLLQNGHQPAPQRPQQVQRGQLAAPAAPAAAAVRRADRLSR